MGCVINARRGKNSYTHGGGGLVDSGQYERVWTTNFWLLSGLEPQNVQTVQCFYADYNILAPFQLKEKGCERTEILKKATRHLDV
jgi:hypothetical protein